MHAAAAMTFILIAARATALCAAAPLFGARGLPARVRLLLALWLSVAAFPAAQQLDLDVRDFLWLAGSEVVLGLAVGSALRGVFELGYAAAQLIGLGAGFGFSALLDPQSGQPSAAHGQLVSVLSLTAALALGLHRDIVAWFVHSIVVATPGTLGDLRPLLSAVVVESLRGVSLATKLAIPALACITAAQVMMGVLQRSVPGAGFTHIAFAGPLAVGLWAFSEVAAGLATHAARAAAAALPS